MYEKVVGVGLGYLVYKAMMTELAKEPKKEGIKVISKGLLGFKGVTPKELEVAIFGNGIGGGRPSTPEQRLAWSEIVSTPFSETYEQWSLLYGSLLPEGFELVGPSRTGLTRPKGLD